MGYFGTNSELPALIPFQVGQLTGFYEAGKLRYLRIGETEVLRMIYPAIRDRNWETAPSQITNEKLSIEADSFSIEYTSRYQLNEVDYQASYRIAGDANGSLSIEMHGEALSTFWRNRIGLCVLHPIEPCTGKPVVITHPDQSKAQRIFPDLISPHQPFFDVQGMAWSPVEGIGIQLDFEGDVFETEDQRNWTDNSYKTYSTPLALPYPVEIQVGEKLYQKLDLQWSVSSGAVDLALQNEIEISLSGSTFPFPALGTGAVQPTISTELLAQFQALPFDYFSVPLYLDQDTWQTDLEKAVAQAKALNKKIALSAFFTHKVDGIKLADALSTHIDVLLQLCVLSALEKVPDVDLMETIYTGIKSRFPQLPVGFGTDGFFTALNRNRPATTQFDFLQFSINPQVHAVDTRTMIENLATQREVVLTAQSFAAGKPLCVSPISLRPRHTPDPADAIDPRQHSSFAAAWMLISLKYLAPCAALTYFEAIGEKGLFPEDLSQTPLLEHWQQITQFQPVKILDTRSNSPLEVELLLLENVKGEQLAFWVNFSSKVQKLTFEGLGIELAPASIRVQV
jgi:D-apionolactonase